MRIWKMERNGNRKKGETKTEVDRFYIIKKTRRREDYREKKKYTVEQLGGQY